MNRPDFHSETGFDRLIKEGRRPGAATSFTRCKHYPSPPPGLAGIRPTALEHSRAATPPGCVNSTFEIDTTICDILIAPTSSPTVARVHLTILVDRHTGAIVSMSIGENLRSLLARRD